MRYLLLVMMITASIRSAAQTEDYASKNTKNWLSKVCDAEVISYTSQYSSSYEALNLLMRTMNETDAPSNYIWCSEEGAKFPHVFVLKLCRKGGTISKLYISNRYEDDVDGNEYKGSTAKNITIEVSNDPDKGFVKVADLTLKRSTHKQLFNIEPVTAKYMRVSIRSNHGHPSYTVMGGIQAY